MASASPRRAALLQGMGVPFTLAPTALAEPPPKGEDATRPEGYVERLALLKAEACRPGLLPAKTLVLAADTVVWHGGQIYNKPRDEAEAVRMLQGLRGQAHRVLTGICLRAPDRTLLGHETTEVRFSEVSDKWIAEYVATGEPMDKAGAYAAQGRGALLIERITGDYWNVVGLPLARLGRMLAQCGAPVEHWWESETRAAI